MPALEAVANPSSGFYEEKGRRGEGEKGRGGECRSLNNVDRFYSFVSSIIAEITSRF